MPSDFYRLYLTEAQQDFEICEEIEDLLDAVTCAPDSLDGLVILDCFWQLEDPIQFLRQLETALKPDAKAVFIEPLLSPVSYLIARMRHPNHLDIKVKPYEKSGKINFASPSLIFDRIENRIQFMKEFPSLTFDKRERLNLFTGCLPENSDFLKKAKQVDDFLMPFLGNFAASHMLVELRKKP